MMNSANDGAYMTLVSFVHSGYSIVASAFSQSLHRSPIFSFLVPTPAFKDFPNAA